MSKNNTNEPLDVYKIIKRIPSLNFLTEAHEAVENRSFVEKIDWDPKRAANYLAILEDVVKSFDTSTKLGECKAEAFTDIYFVYKDNVDCWNDEHPEEEQLKADKGMLDRWQKAVQDRIKRKTLSFNKNMNIEEESYSCLCETVYVEILKYEIEYALSLKNICEQVDVELPDYETLKLETLTAVYDYFEWYVDSDDFESEECQEFFEKWKEALEE